MGCINAKLSYCFDQFGTIRNIQKGERKPQKITEEDKTLYDPPKKLLVF